MLSTKRYIGVADEIVRGGEQVKGKKIQKLVVKRVVGLRSHQHPLTSVGGLVHWPRESGAVKHPVTPMSLVSFCDSDNSNKGKNPALLRRPLEVRKGGVTWGRQGGYFLFGRSGGRRFVLATLCHGRFGMGVKGGPRGLTYQGPPRTPKHTDNHTKDFGKHRCNGGARHASIGLIAGLSVP